MKIVFSFIIIIFSKRASQFFMLHFLLAVWTRLELATPCVTGMYSNQLNYQTVL